MTAPQLDLYTTILRVSDLEKSVAWYADVLGLTPNYHDDAYRLTELTGVKGQRIILRELKERPIKNSGLDGVYVVFLTASAVESHDDFVRRGLHVGPVQDQPGVRLFWLFDLDKHPLCILEFAVDWPA
jgi:catechol 2,3-dioxygenase-like lactoylglutathione lyase family enzyme